MSAPRVRHTGPPGAPLVALLLAVCSAACQPTAASPVAAPEARALREHALTTARVWEEPLVPIAEADLRSNPAVPNALSPTADVQCRFTLEPVGGTTPKFYCEIPGGERLKVKYGRGNPELYAEVATSRLLNALGFGADHMFVVQRVRCAGCPTLPFQSLRCLQRFGLAFACLPGGVDERAVVDFDVAVVERRLAGRVIEAVDDEGWAWYELERIDASRGGASRADVDALRLMAVFLAHWDNKAANQRLICPPGEDRPDGSCAAPRAIIQDLGATFGPLKLELHNWRRERIWQDPATCTVSMKHLPWGGGTFPDRRISEDGRLMLLRLLAQLSDRQLRDLFEGARVTQHDQFSAEGRDASAWVRAFQQKVQQIRDAGPCPG